MRLFVYSQDGMGLGHLRRTHNIARAVVERQPDAEVLIVADSPVAPFFSPLPRVRYLKLPTLVKTSDKTWSARGASLRATLDARGRRIREAFIDFAPDNVLVDHMPAGALGELLPMLDEAAARPDRPGLFLGLRDVLDHPETISRMWSDAGAYEVLDRYDVVLVYGCKEVHDSAVVYGLESLARKVVYCNYVATRRLPAPWGTDGERPLVLFTGGGGADAYQIARSLLDGFPRILDNARARCCILTGPNMSADERADLEDRARGLPVLLPWEDEDAILWLSRASVVVTMAGYNTLCEVLQWRKRALVIPRSGPSAEQRIRSRLFEDNGLVRRLEPEEASAESIAHEVVTLLSDHALPDASRIPALDGADNAAIWLLDGARSNGNGGGRQR